MERVLVSACLMGHPVRYNGQGKRLDGRLFEKWHEEGRLISFCPELAGGFSVPRLPAEIEGGRTGADVLAGKARVIDSSGENVTEMFIDGAYRTLEFARLHGCRFAMLIDGSPSCGSISIYDGSFSGQRSSGEGVTTALLRDGGIEIFAPSRIEELAQRLRGSLSV